MHKLLKRFRKYDVYVPIVLTMENKEIELALTTYLIQNTYQNDMKHDLSVDSNLSGYS